MLLAYCVIAAILFGYLRGGRLRHYLHAPLHLVFLPAVAFLIEASFAVITDVTSLPASVWLGYAVCAEYLLLALFIWFNRRYPGIRLLGLASAANFAVIAANGFRMPVTPLIYEKPALAGFVTRIQAGDLPEYVLVDWNAPLWFLGDTIPLFNGLASAGDLLMAAAIFVIILHMMTAQPTETTP